MPLRIWHSEDRPSWYILPEYLSGFDIQRTVHRDIFYLNTSQDLTFRGPSIVIYSTWIPLTFWHSEDRPSWYILPEYLSRFDIQRTVHRDIFYLNTSHDLTFRGPSIVIYSTWIPLRIWHSEDRPSWYILPEYLSRFDIQRTVHRDIFYLNTFHDLTFRGPSIVIYSTWIPLTIWHSEDRPSWYILIIKPTRCTNFSNLFWNRTLHVSDKFSVHQQESCTVYTAIGLCHTGYADCLLASSQHNLYDIYLLLCIRYKTPVDGQKTCPKHVEFYSKINLRNLCSSLVLL